VGLDSPLVGIRGQSLSVPEPRVITESLAVASLCRDGKHTTQRVRKANVLSRQKPIEPLLYRLAILSIPRLASTDDPVGGRLSAIFRERWKAVH